MAAAGSASEGFPASSLVDQPVASSSSQRPATPSNQPPHPADSSRTARRRLSIETDRPDPVSIRRRSTISPTRFRSDDSANAELYPTRTLSRIRSTRQTTSSEDPERPSAPRPPSPPPPEANAPPPVDEVTISRLTAHYGVLVLASMIGCLIRLGLEALATYDGSVVFPLLWAQGVGCGVMGYALGRKNEISWLYPPLYTFLTTGIAGSVTTFSSWMLEGFLAFSNASGFSRGGLHDAVDGVAYSFSTWLVSLAGINVGLHFSQFFPPILLRVPRRTEGVELKRVPTRLREGDPVITDQHDSSTSSENTAAENGVTDPSAQNNPLDADSDEKPLRRNPITGSTPMLDGLVLLSGAACYLVTLLLYFLGPYSWRHKVLFSMLLSPPGAMARFALGRINVKPSFIDRFPLGTFIANMSATMIISGVYVGQRQGNVGRTRCNALYAIQQGFCGCLSTVSTLAVESRAVRGTRWRWTYVGGSVILGHLFVLAIVGGELWGPGLGTTVCSG